MATIVDSVNGRLGANGIDQLHFIKQLRDPRVRNGRIVVGTGRFVPGIILGKEIVHEFI
jgi:hypothetical protein